MKKELLKNKVKQYWNKASCGTEFISEIKFSKKYFDEIENFRYSIEPEIFSFAQFSRYRNKKVLEVGVGAGTDFIQWVRSGAQAYGIDLTQEAIDNVKSRLVLEQLNACELKVADAENLPYNNNCFDLVYSWGVIHHSPNTIKCLNEIIRVVKPGGSIKLMVYNRHSLFAFYRWLLAALFKGKPFRSIKDVLFYDQESPGTKAYTFKEVRKILYDLPVDIISIDAKVSSHDLLYYKSKFFQYLAYICTCIFGWNKVGWFITIEFKKKEKYE